MGTKKTDTAKKAVKETAKKADEAVKETAKKAEKAVKETAKKAETVTKTVAQKTDKAVKQTAKKVEKKAETVKKTADKKSAPKKSAKKPEPQVYFEFAGKQIAVDDIKSAVENAYVSAGNKASTIKSAKLYVKAEDSAVYFVINDEDKGKVVL